MEFDSPSSPRLDIFGSMGPAWNRMKEILFPFNMGKWFALGLIIFLEILSQGGNGGLGNLGDLSKSVPSSPAEAAQKIDDWFEMMKEYTDIAIMVAIPVMLLIFVLFLLVLWVSVRGQLMFARAVARDEVAFGVNWNATKHLAGSLFKFRLVLAIIASSLTLGAFGSLFLIFYRLLRRNETDVTAYFFELGPIALAWFVALLIPSIITAILRNFVVPLMLHLQQPCMNSFRTFMPILKTNVGTVVLFFVVRSFFFLFFGFANTMLTLMTCCIGGLPVINQALTSPFHVFDRAWSMCALRSLGKGFDVFSEKDIPLPPPTNITWGQND